MRPENQDAKPPDIVGFCDVLGSMETQETRFPFQTHAPLWMYIRVDQPSAEIALAVNRLEAGNARPHGDIGSGSHCGRDDLSRRTLCSKKNHRGPHQKSRDPLHCVTTMVIVCVSEMPELCPVPTILKV